jgi:hypothetical protein
MSDWLEKMGVSILKNQESSAVILEKFVETARPAGRRGAAADRTDDRR